MKKKGKVAKQKKAKRVLNHGITGQGTDYSVYIMSPIEIASALILGFAVGFGACFLYFGIVGVSIVFGLICAFIAIRLMRNHKQQKRSDELRVQFRDLLESLSNSFTVGKNASAAFVGAYDDMYVEHGPKAYITKELALINLAHTNQGYEIGELLDDFATRSGSDDIRSFSSVFSVCTNLAGDVGRVVRETRDMINDKIEVELEIQTMVKGEKSQLNILAVMPILVGVLLRVTNMVSDGPAVVIVKSIALVLFAFAYWLGTKITDIKL